MTLAKYDLMVLAAGMGSRFGGVKQVQPVGPHGELIIEYSAFDALRAGFGRLVLVIRKDLEADFRAAIGRRLEARMDVAYVFQDRNDLPAGHAPPSGRVKQWGTGHAVLAGRNVVKGPFAAINADDFLGASGYRELAAHFGRSDSYAMVGYQLDQTLSENGTVSRGLCEVDPDGRLRRITEITKIEKLPGGGASYTDAGGVVRRLTGREIVSMNNWGLTPAVFPQLERLFQAFLERSGQDPKAEFYLPTALSELNERNEARIELFRSADSWFGITYREDTESTRAALAALVRDGRYPAPLWG